MDFSFYSVLMAVFSSGILIGILYPIRKKSYFAKKFGYVCIVLMYLLCILRIFLPINFSFTKGISNGGIYSDVCDILCFDKYRIGNCEFVIAEALFIIWVFVAFLKIGKFLLEYKSTERVLSMFPERKDMQCSRVMQRVFEETGKQHDVTIFYSDGIHMPMGMGIRKWRIYLPKQEYTDKELYYILLHEYTHFLNGDLFVKVLSYILCCIFWWNPFVYLMKKDLDKSLEKKCDLSIVEKLSIYESADYLQTTVDSLKASYGKKQFFGVHYSVSLGNGKNDEMTERFRIVLENKKNEKKNIKSIICWFLVFGIVWIASYSVILIPAYEAPIEEIEDVLGAVALTPDDVYILYKNGEYYHIMEIDDQIIQNKLSSQEVGIFEDCGIEIRGRNNDEKNEGSFWNYIFMFTDGIY